MIVLRVNISNNYFSKTSLISNYLFNDVALLWYYAMISLRLFPNGLSLVVDN